MKNNFRKPELVAPGGNLAKLKIAALYGADAVYIGMPGLNLRTRASEVSISDIEEGARFLHERGKKIYVAMNVFARNRHLAEVKRLVGEVAGLSIDALIVSDPGVFLKVREVSADIPIHLSTQSNTTNCASAGFWFKQGIKRIVLARELSFDEIAEVNGLAGGEMEVFVHGAMCMSYSGRCLLSSYMTDRSANLGDCSHSCRWKYTLREETRPNESFPIEEDEGGAYILSSRDLCMIGFVSELMNTGVAAWKIEGRMKSQYYVAAVTRVYREAIDRFFEVVGDDGGTNGFVCRKEWSDELGKVSHRAYSTGFFFGSPEAGSELERDDEKENCGYIRSYKYLGLVEEVLSGNMARVTVKNKIKLGSDVEIMGRRLEDDYMQKVVELYDVNEKPLHEANPGQVALLKMAGDVGRLSIIRCLD